MKKLMLLGDVNSPHIQKWSVQLSNRGWSILLFSLSEVTSDWFVKHENIQLLNLGSGFKREMFEGGLLKKVNYLKLVSELKKAIKEFKPDVLHAHYASSYGFMGALTGFHPYVISVWGSDVFEFPKKFVGKSILKYNFKKADLLTVTSNSLLLETAKYTKKSAELIHFGIDCSQFKKKTVSTHNPFVFGIIKYLEKEYGIDKLIAAFALFIKEFPKENVQLKIVGNGSLYPQLKKQVDDLQISEKVDFTGSAEYSAIDEFHAMMDIEIYPSISEGFGVSVLEAQAVGNPVITSNVGGLPEVVVDGETGYLLEDCSAQNIFEKMKVLYFDRILLNSMSEKASDFVNENYDLKKGVDQLENHYFQLLKLKK